MLGASETQRGLMKEKQRCANCGTTRFGLIRHKWYRHQFCRKKCLDQFLIKVAKDKEQFSELAQSKGTLLPGETERATAAAAEGDSGYSAPGLDRAQ